MAQVMKMVRCSLMSLSSLGQRPGPRHDHAGNVAILPEAAIAAYKETQQEVKVEETNQIQT